MAKNMLLVMPKLTNDDRMHIRHILDIKDDQILSFQNKWKTAWALNKKGHKRLAKKILWYMPLIVFAINYYYAMCVVLGVLAVLGFFLGSILLIIYLAKEVAWPWALIAVPYGAILYAVVKTLDEYYL